MRTGFEPEGTPFTSKMVAPTSTVSMYPVLTSQPSP